MKMMRKRCHFNIKNALYLAGAFLALVMLSCCDQVLQSGRYQVQGLVVEKRHNVAIDMIMYDPVLQINTIHHTQEQWIVVVRDSSGHEHVCNVQKKLYKRLEIGDSVCEKGRFYGNETDE